LAPFLVALWAFCIEPGLLVVRHVRMELPGWREDVRIAVVSDLHIGSPHVGIDRLRRVVERMNAENPALVVLLGDYVIGGWRSGARKLGGLLVGVPTEDGLVFRGRVGGGIGAVAEKELLSRLEPLARRDSPFAPGAVPREDAKGAHWVDPQLVVEVRYGNRTPDGRLRFPRFLRLRDDKTPQDCAEEDEDVS